jgi:hypothetical protein
MQSRLLDCKTSSVLSPSGALFSESAGAPLSPISENTSSRIWRSSTSLHFSKDPVKLEKKLSGRQQSADPAAAELEAPDARPLVSEALRVSEHKRPGTAEALQVGRLRSAGRAGRSEEDLDSYMEQMLSKERAACREQRRSQQNGAHA